MSVKYYLPLQHNLVAKSLLKLLILKQNPLDKYKHQKEPKYVYNVGNVEYWWNLSIQTTTKLLHNKPDIVIWNRGQETCNIVEISFPADTNISKKIEEKLNNYRPLVCNMQMIYPEYKLMVNPITIGVLGNVLKCLSKNLIELGFDNREIKKLTQKLQNI